VHQNMALDLEIEKRCILVNKKKLLDVKYNIYFIFQREIMSILEYLINFNQKDFQ
jgi:hypothetical protein